MAANTPFSLIASSGSSKVVHIYNLKNSLLHPQRCCRRGQENTYKLRGWSNDKFVYASEDE